ncbi:hypothetical protein [Thalassotalea agariperforans]
MAAKSVFFTHIKHAFKENLMPGIFLQVIALLIGCCYFFWPSAQPVFTFIASVKSENSIMFAMLSTALFGGLIPFIFLLAMGRIKFKPVQQGLFYCFLWGFIGLVVDYFYGWQAVWFGIENNVATIAIKTFVDQFIFSALLTCPFMTIAYLWKDQQFNFGALKSQLNKSLFTLKIPSIVITNWLIWIPSVSLIYMMPRALQLPLFNVVLCFFVIVLAVLTAPETSTSHE